MNNNVIALAVRLYGGIEKKLDWALKIKLTMKLLMDIISDGQAMARRATNRNDWKTKL